LAAAAIQYKASQFAHNAWAAVLRLGAVLLACRLLPGWQHWNHCFNFAGFGVARYIWYGR
jgi:hypothetical protein